MQSSIFTAATKPARASFKGAPVRSHVAVSSRRSRMVTCAGLELATVGASYASALVEAAEQKGLLEAIHADVDTLSSLMKEDENIRDFLFNPTVAPERKSELLRGIAAESDFEEFTTEFLELVLKQDRLEALEEICEAFENKYCAMTATEVAILRSAVKLEEEQQFLIAKKLQEMTGSPNIKLRPVIDTSLIAGFTLEWGAFQMDLSLKSQLEKVTSEIASAAMDDIVNEA